MMKKKDWRQLDRESTKLGESVIREKYSRCSLQLQLQGSIAASPKMEASRTDLVHDLPKIV